MVNDVRVAEPVRYFYSGIDKVIAETKQVSMMSSRGQMEFTTETNLPLPPEPVLTRLNTSLMVALHYAEKFDQM